MTLFLVMPADALRVDGFYRFTGSHETLNGRVEIERMYQKGQVTGDG